MIIESIIGVGGAVLAAYLWETQIRDRVSVRRIVRPDDPDTEMLLDLYQDLFPEDGTNYTPYEILEVVDVSLDFGSDRHAISESIVLVAKYRGDVVGFILCHFYPKRHKAIISYLGINRDVLEARRQAAGKLLRSLKRILVGGKYSCEYLFFDLQGIDSQTAKKEAGERKARPVRFKQSAKRLGLPAYLLQFPYVCPKISLDDDAQEYPFTLMCVPISGHLPNPVPKSLILEFLEFLYKDCYGDYYAVSDKRFQPYQEYLQQRLNHYEDTLPVEINVK